MSRFATPIALLCALMALALPSAAMASRTQSMTFEAPRDLLDPNRRAAALNEIGSFGVSSLRLVLYWQNVAPSTNSRVRPNVDLSNPAAYNWGQYDAVVAAAKARNWKLLFTVSGPVPRWATNGAKDHLTRPRARDFRTFMQAVARHYGAQVDTWSIWNEPNQPQFLKPQYGARKKPLSPAIYRSLFIAGQQGLRDGGLRRAKVLLGETSPRGTGSVVSPLNFLRTTLCLNKSYKHTRKCSKLNVAGYAHHAYTTGQGPTFRPPQPNDVTIGVLSRLTTALDRAARAGALPRGLPIWLTEFGIESKPDPLRGVSLAKQSDFRSISERISYYNRRVVAFSQYLLRDDLPRRGVPRLQRYPGFETGLRTAAGKAKPSLAGFRLPLVVQRKGSRVNLWGLVRPAHRRTRVTVQVRKGGGAWKTLRTVGTNGGGYVTARSAYGARLTWRLQWKSPSGTVLRGSTTKAY
jgi:hypothetical protein